MRYCSLRASGRFPTPKSHHGLVIRLAAALRMHARSGIGAVTNAKFCTQAHPRVFQRRFNLNPLELAREGNLESGGGRWDPYVCHERGREFLFVGRAFLMWCLCREDGRFGPSGVALRVARVHTRQHAEVLKTVVVSDVVKRADVGGGIASGGGGGGWDRKTVRSPRFGDRC